MRVVGGWKGFPTGLDGGEGLGDCVGNATEDLGRGESIMDLQADWGVCAYSVGNHRCEDRLFRIVGVELGYQPHGDGHFDDEYDRV